MPASAGIAASRARTSSRRRRLTRLRVTAVPTALDTTRPTTGPEGEWSVLVVRCTTRVSRPPRAPRRTACSKSAARRMRCAADSTDGGVRPRAPRGPCDDEPPGSRGRRGYAYAGGSHGSWPGAGCSAGRCAWSRESPTTSGGPRMCRATRFRLPRSNCSQDTHRVRAASGRASRSHREGCNTVLPAVLAGQMRATRRSNPPTGPPTSPRQALPASVPDH